ncbi:HTTM domain-containing protein [Yoonia sediminilitoris]|uniref:Vitamin K-dependent gamma-carboxylase-like protein n=1 Tax=Yoonia sediminilitoris TaxID=1286148 RepID=A0A2T6KES2_9RHOB|nr:HTTM domain-containing protein [Yoonia sediminilitoris]PUB13621.1 vitamin K-dependent gamma-carboxylase-like protein [Yoonia sediminilitoris]RCW94791.1 vitamin K-dependent gamma-carboxylase-like protein [Yoonia sediminilitoris]
MALSLHSIAVLRCFAGPYNGGSDRMGLLVLCRRPAARLPPDEFWSEIAFSYLAVQVVLSYFISGQVKIVNPDWRIGRALQDVFSLSAYPVSEQLRALADRPMVPWAMSWLVMLFEVLFPLSLLSQQALCAALVLAAAFYLANACLFGLNRFVWF